MILVFSLIVIVAPLVTGEVGQVDRAHLAAGVVIPVISSTTGDRKVLVSYLQATGKGLCFLCGSRLCVSLMLNFHQTRLIHVG
jgi:hypothetical protein